MTKNNATEPLTNTKIDIATVKHLSDGFELLQASINVRLPHISYLRGNNKFFTVQRGSATNQLNVQIETDQLSLFEIAEYLKIWLNTPPFVFYAEVFCKLYRHDISKLTHGEWECKCFGALGDIEYFINYLLPNIDVNAATKTSVEQQFKFGKIDYTKPFYSFQLTDLETRVAPRPLHHFADIQNDSSDSLIVQMNPDLQNKAELESILQKLKSADPRESFIEKLHAWSQFVTQYLWDYRLNERVFKQAPWDESTGFDFLSDHSAYRTGILAPLEFNRNEDEWRLENGTVDLSKPHIKIEQFVHDGRRNTVLLGLLAVESNNIVRLEAKEEWHSITTEELYQLHMWFQEDIFLVYDFHEVIYQLLQRCIKTTYLKNEFRGMRTLSLSFTHMKNNAQSSTYDELCVIERELQR